MAGGLEKFLGLFRKDSRQEPKSVIEQPEVSVKEADIELVREGKLYQYGEPRAREFYFWGWDSKRNPAFLVLYGEQKVKGRQGNEGYLLEDDVFYTDYAVFRGVDGHFPAFEAVKIWEGYDYKTRKRTKNMYYKKDIRKPGYWYPQEGAQPVKDYGILKKGISLHYYHMLTYQRAVAVLKEAGVRFSDFTLADSKGQVMELPENLAVYDQTLKQLFSYPNLYIRKKLLNQLLDQQPGKELYQYLLKKGSGELIAGLFLELGHRGDSCLAEAAVELLQKELNWLSQRYAHGVKRCITIYLYSINEEQKNQRRKVIYNHLPEIDLKLVKVDGIKVLEENQLEGKHYKKYAGQQVFTEFSGRYVRENGKYRYIKERKKDMFEVSHYCDGVVFNLLELKNTIQEAESYQMPDVIGKIAYYLDAPRLHFYLSGSGQGRALRYYKRYLRRIIDSYAKTDEALFITAVKELVTSYTNADYLSGFQDNFQENYFIKHYLYHQFEGRKPYEWNAAREWVRNDQLKKLTGRYEYQPEIWDRHPEAVVDILMEARIEVVLKAFYYIFEGIEQREAIISKLTYEQLIRLTESPYQPVAAMFKEVLAARLNQQHDFNIDTMLMLMNSQNPVIREIAISYFKRTNGMFPADQLIRIMLLDSAADWLELLEENLKRLDTEEYLLFLQGVISHSADFGKEGLYDSKEFMEVMEQSLFQVEALLTDQLTKLVEVMLACLKTLNRERGFLAEFIEKVIFSADYGRLKEVADSLALPDRSEFQLSKFRLIVDLLHTIGKGGMLQDYQISELLQTGTSRMIKAFIKMCGESEAQLQGRYSALLLLMESDLTPLNELAVKLFNQLPINDQQELHRMLLDSPDKKTYQFALEQLYQIYNQQDQMIPPEFVARMLEHSSYEVKAYITDKLIRSIEDFGNGNHELFLYYVKTMLYLPNKAALAKQRIYQLLPEYVRKNTDKSSEIEELLLDLGNSNTIKDAEHALVALGQIRNGGVLIEG